MRTISTVGAALIGLMIGAAPVLALIIHRELNL